MKPRDYQESGITAVLESFKSNRSCLGVAATGLGKTVIFSHVAERQSQGRVLVLAHREELVFQAAKKIESITGEAADIEMADYVADQNGIFNRARVVVSTIQTLNAGKDGGRMQKFDPADFSTIITDEAHHATAASYRRVYDHFMKNPRCRHFGVTATPDRADEEALGQVFEVVAFEYDIQFGIGEGYLVPIMQRSVVVDSLDLSQVRTVAGDLNQSQLAQLMEFEQALHEIAHPLIEIAAGRQTLVFAASVAHAERLAEIFNRHKPDSARWVCGETPKDERRQIFAEFGQKKAQFLVNVGVATEGYDEPGVEVVALARPTKSRSLYAQMIGRGTRVHPTAGIEHDGLTAGDRRSLIAASCKPSVEVIDFVGISGTHKLVSVGDILGGNYSDEIVERAKKNAEQDDTGPSDMQAELEKAEEELEAEAEAERRKRMEVKAKANYRIEEISPFDTLNIRPWREKGWDKGRQLSEKQVAVLEKNGINVSRLTYTEGKQLIGELMKRRAEGRCTHKQARILERNGYPTDMTFEQASQTIDGIFGKSTKPATKEPVLTKAEVTF